MTDNIKKQIGNTVQERIEKLLLLLIAVYLFSLSIYASNYEFPLPYEFMLLLYILTAVVAARTFLMWRGNRNYVFAFLVAVVYVLAYTVVRSYFLLFMAVLSIGTVDIDYRKIVRLYSVIICIFCFLWITASLIGLLPNIVYYRSGGLRSSWGMAYPTDFASLLLFLLMMTWLAWKEVSDYSFLVSGIILFFFSWKITDSRTTMICCVICWIVALIHIIENRIVNGQSIFIKVLDSIRKLAIFTFPFGILLTVLSVVAYMNGNSFAVQLNALLTKRLALTQIIYEDQGIHAFGKLFSMVGNGGTNVQPLGLYFLDSSYSNILICHGWVTLTVVCIIWVRMSWLAYHRKDYRLLSVMTLIAFHALAEHHFKDLNYNVLLALPFATISATEGKNVEKSKLKELLSSRKPLCLTVLVEIAVFVYLLPHILSRMRTILGLYGDIIRWSQRLLILFCILLLTVLLIIFAVQLCKVIDAIHRKQTIERKTIALVIASGMLLCTVVACDSMRIKNGEEIYAEQLKAEGVVMDTVLSASSGNVIVEEIPEVYHRKYGILYRPFFWGDDLARLSSVSVITDRITDRQRFIDCGFLYTSISDQHAIYSNDESLIDAMTAEGFVWTDYYPEKKYLDLVALAEDNNLPLTEDGYILLVDGQEFSNGPWVDLQKGRYVVRFRIQIKNSEFASGDELCTLEVTDFYHLRSLAKKTIDIDSFNGKNKSTKGVRFYTSGSRAMELGIYPKSDHRIVISEISYQKIAK